MCSELATLILRRFTPGTAIGNTQDIIAKIYTQEIGLYKPKNGQKKLQPKVDVPVPGIAAAKCALELVFF